MTNAPWNDEMKRDREQFAELGANMAGILQSEIDRVGPATNPRDLRAMQGPHY